MSNIITPLLCCKHLISYACVCGRRTLSVISKIHDHSWVLEKNIELNIDSYTQRNSIALVFRQGNNARITANALPDQTANFFFIFLPSLMNVIPWYFNFSICFSDTSPTCKEQDLSKDEVYLSFGSADFCYIQLQNHLMLAKG